jgi:hypothetical protein
VILHTDKIQLACAMLISGIFLAQWLASKKSFLVDFIAGLVGLFIVLCILAEFHVI